MCAAVRSCEQGCGHLIRQPSAATFPLWGRLWVNADNDAAGCKHTPLRSVASLLRKHCPRPTSVDQYLACSQKKERKTLFIVGGDVLDAPKNKRREQNTLEANQIPPFIVGTGVLDCPFRYESNFFHGVRATSCLTVRKNKRHAQIQNG